MTYRFTSVALTELREASLQYEAKDRGLGVRFFREVDQTISNKRPMFPKSVKPGITGWP